MILGPRQVSAEPALGEQIRARRRAISMTLHELAREAGCSRSYLSQIENGRVAPPGEAILARLEMALRFGRGELCGPARASRPRGPAALQRDLARIESALARLTGLLDEPRRKAGPGIPVIAERGGPAGPQRAERLRVPGLRDPSAFALRLRSEPAAPAYRAGDLVIFTRARSAPSGSDCFVRLAPGPAGRAGLFARVRFSGLGPVRAEPLARPGPAQLIPREKIAGLSPAIAIIRTVPVRPQHPIE